MVHTLLNRINVRRGRTYLLVLLAIGCIGWGLYASLSWVQPAPTKHLRLGAGPSVARRFQIAQCLAANAHTCELDVSVVATKGFNDSIQQITEGKLDLAMVSSGLESPNCKDIRLLAGLDVAPLHIFVRHELAESGGSLLDVIKGRRVNLGEVGTNDRQLASDLLSFLRLSPIDETGRGDYTGLSLNNDDVTQLAENIQALSGSAREERLRELPDVVMCVGSLPSQVGQRLINTHEYCLLPFPYAQPFLISNLEGSSSPNDSLNRRYIEPATIPAAMYVGNDPIPARDCPTVGMRTLLVARADLPAVTVERLMRTVFETDFTRRINPQTPREITTTYEIHSGATAYLDRNQPLITGQFFENISKALSIFGAFSAGALSLYSYLRRRRIRRPGEYLEELRVVDALASGQQLEGETSATPEALIRQLDTRLVKLKEQLVHDYCNNRVQGEMVVMSILSMLADSRAELQRTIARSPKPETTDTQLNSRRAA